VKSCAGLLSKFSNRIKPDDGATPKLNHRSKSLNPFKFKLYQRRRNTVFGRGSFDFLTGISKIDCTTSNSTHGNSKRANKV
jgi:hypothetical protein